MRRPLHTLPTVCTLYPFTPHPQEVDLSVVVTRLRRENQELQARLREVEAERDALLKHGAPGAGAGAGEGGGGGGPASVTAASVTGAMLGVGLGMGGVGVGVGSGAGPGPASGPGSRRSSVSGGGWAPGGPGAGDDSDVDLSLDPKDYTDILTECEKLVVPYLRAPAGG